MVASINKTRLFKEINAKLYENSIVIEIVNEIN